MLFARGYALLILLYLPNIILAHETHHHAKTQPASTLAQVNERYFRSVKPIFHGKCFDCHSTSIHWPWYHSIPGIKQLLEKDAAEGRKHIDMSNDFPFEGHGSPLEDLDAIEKTVNDGTMPPWNYRLMHPSSTLTDSEKSTVLRWIEESREILKKSDQVQ